MRRVSKRLVSFLLIFCVLVQVVVFSPVTGAAAVSTHHGNFSIEGISIDYENTLVEEGDGRYLLEMTVRSAFSEEVHNTDVRVAENGTYRVSKEGFYLVELWGGDGADGADTTAAGGSKGGKGGKGGHVYAEMYLKKDQVLFYTLGGNGSPTHATGAGGGINGDGGHHGASGGDTVGGGGGYSALFLYEYDEIASKYGSRFVTEIDETDRTSRYIMIAGGGGGGGAGNGSMLLGIRATGTADGGAGGSMTTASGVISGTGIVSGTFYAGINGKSSGTSTAYIGRGGTNLPGRVPDTWISNVSGTEPNDWAATVHQNYAGGAGGSGNLRGGAGGAGFCGGSGGVMTGTIIPTNVGGGGGGSSFLAEQVNGYDLTNPLSAEAEGYLMGENPSTTGGALCVTYLGEVDESFLGDLTLSATFSKYFVPVDGGYYQPADGERVDGKLVWEESEDGSESHSLLLTGASLLTDEGKAGGSFKLKLYVTPIDGFAGGNNVPILDGYMTCVATEHPTEIRYIDLGASCGYANVPLKLPIITHSFKAGEPGELFYVDDLYTDTYTDIRESLSSDLRYDFISSIGAFQVTDPDGQLLPTDGTLTPQKTTSYRVYLPVTLKDTGVATVGDPIPLNTRISGVAKIEVMTSVSAMLGDYEVTYTKSVVYDEADGSYLLSVNMTSGVSSTGEIVPDEGINHHQEHSSSADGFEHPIAVTGYYLVRLWAGNGGTGANGFWSGNGSGGVAGHVDAYLLLEKGWYVKGIIGQNGNNGSGNSGGGGGSYTYMEILDENKQSLGVLAVAAGGGGGGGGAIIGPRGRAGGTPAATTGSYTGNLADYVGGSGESGRFLSGTAAKGGTTRDNFLATSVGGNAVYTTDNTTALTKDTALVSLNNALSAGDHTSETGGGVGIHFLMSTRDDESIKDDYDKVFSEYTVTLPISPYFEVVDAYGEERYGETAGLVYDPITLPTYVSGMGSEIVFANINPEEYAETVDEGGEHFHMHLYVDFTLYVKVKPAELFFGGNDVPLYEGAATVSHIQYHTGENGTVTSEVPEISLQENYVTDYVNVAVPKAEFTLTGHDVYVENAGDAVTREELFTLGGVLPFMVVAEADAWRYDFVTVEDTYSAFTTVYPTVTTTYTVTVGVRAKAAPVRATVGKVATGGDITVSATAYVGYAVFYELTDLTTSHTPTDGGVYYVEKGESLSAVLTPVDGKFLPTAITVLSGDRVLTVGTDYTYNPKTGAYTVYASSIDGNLTVRAEGANELHTLYFLYMGDPKATEPIQLTQTYGQGASLADAIFHTFVPVEYDGYDFVLDFGNGSTVAPSVMPDGDLWVMGFYVAKTYDLTVEYRDENGAPLAGVSDHTERLTFGADYSVTSPIVQGYLADLPVVEGVMPATDLTVRVTYSENLGVLTVIYLKRLPDGSTEQISVYTDNTLKVGDEYSVSAEPILGYTPDMGTVSGTMTDGGVTAVVTYAPDRYTVSFSDPSGGRFDSVTVTFDDLYGHYSTDGGASFAYDALPTPIRAGYVFDGWYLKGAKVVEDTVVATAEDHTLTARWTAVRYNVTVRYLYEDGTEAVSEIHHSLPFESEYSYTTPAIYGHTADKLTVSGKVPAQNTVITVIYGANGLTLTVTYVDAVKGTTVAEKVVLELKHGETYAVTSPTVAGYDSCSEAVVSGTADAPAPHTVKTVTVYYYESEPTVSVTVTWGKMSFDLTERGIWDPETHTYASDTFAPTKKGDNEVTVENNASSAISVMATYSYEMGAGYETLDVYFTADNDAAADAVTESGMIVPGERREAYVFVKGNMPAGAAAGSYVVGSCKVTLKGGESVE